MDSAPGGRGDTPRLTRLGRRIARMPIDPRLARMVLEADRLGCLREVLVVVAALSVQDPRERPGPDRPTEQAQADQAHARFRDERSDFLAWLNLWRHLREQQRERGSSSFRRMCRREHLNYLRVREWQELETQLRQIVKGIGLRPGSFADQPDADRIHQSLLSGLLSQIGLKLEREERSRGGRRPLQEYLGARGTKFAIFPGSGLRKKQPDLVMAAELVETSRLWAREVAAIDPAWAERLGAHLVKRTYAEPHWSARRAQVVARERVTLYGVPLVADRAVGFGTIDPELSRELFIRHALVQGEWRTRARFAEENRRLLEEAEELEHRARRRGLVVDEQTLFDFYDARVPAEVVSGAHFESWWKTERHEHPDLLTFDPSMLLRDAAEEVTDADYPDTWHEGGLSLPLSYHFEPGRDEDGVTVDVPLATLNQLQPAPFSWQVPGLREELVTALLRGLPKAIRVNVVPAPDTARGFLAAVPPGEEPLTEALARHLRATRGVHVPAEAWDWASVPEHLKPRFRVVDEDGSVVASGRDLDVVTAPLRPSFEAAVAGVAADAGIARSGEKAWVFGTIEPSFRQVRAGHEVQGFPALDDEGTTVGLVVAASADEQEARHRLGLRRLLALQVTSPAKQLVDGLDNAAKLGLAGSPYPSVAALADDVVLAALGDLVDQTLAAAPVLDEAAYDALLARARAEVEPRSRDLLARVGDVLARWREVERALGGRVDLPLLPAMSDLGAQLERLVHAGFVAEAGSARLQHYSRYLAAMTERRDRLAVEPGRDQTLMDQVVPLQQAWADRVAALPVGRPPGRVLRDVRWMLEEYRVSLWAQRLGTPSPVSDARIRKALAR